MRMISFSSDWRQNLIFGFVGGAAAPPLFKNRGTQPKVLGADEALVVQT
jgi:hypothetical protein